MENFPLELVKKIILKHAYIPYKHYFLMTHIYYFIDTAGTIEIKIKSLNF